MTMNDVLTFLKENGCKFEYHEDSHMYFAYYGIYDIARVDTHNAHIYTKDGMYIQFNYRMNWLDNTSDWRAIIKDTIKHIDKKNANDNTPDLKYVSKKFIEI